MDPRSDVTPVVGTGHRQDAGATHTRQDAGATSVRPDLVTAGDIAAVTCEQAIFTSIPSPMGSGYRLVAASRGIKPEERQYIIPRCPSHEGLCDNSADAVGICFYPLPSERVCVNYTCNAGMEQTGRGGHRVYTRILVLDAALMPAFGCNPFDVVRSLVDTHGSEPDLKPPAVLPSLELPTRHQPDANFLAEKVHKLGPGWLARIVTHLLEHQPSVLVGDVPAVPIAEAALLSLPAVLRMQLSLSAGLRFSLGRGFDLTVLDDPNAGRLRQSLHGHNVTLVETTANGASPGSLDSDWGRMVEREWDQKRSAALIRFTSGDFPDTGAQALGQYGRLFSRREELAEVDSPAIVRMLEEHLTESITDELAARLAIGFTTDALGRLGDDFATADIDALTGVWDALVGLWRRSESSATVLGPLVCKALKRATRIKPLNAMELAVKLVKAIQQGAPLSPVQNALDDLLDHLGEWVGDLEPEEATVLEKALEHWPSNGPFIERIRGLRLQLAATSPQTGAVSAARA